MGKHNWRLVIYQPHPQESLSFCTQCGIVDIDQTTKLSCPPWSSTGEGETKTNRVYEAGEVKDLKWIIDGLSIIEETLKIAPNQCHSAIRKIRSTMEKLIQKHEGHEQS